MNIAAKISFTLFIIFFFLSAVGAFMDNGLLLGISGILAMILLSITIIILIWSM